MGDEGSYFAGWSLLAVMVRWLGILKFLLFAFENSHGFFFGGALMARIDEERGDGIVSACIMMLNVVLRSFSKSITRIDI
jgi:hypothetical protein